MSVIRRKRKVDKNVNQLTQKERQLLLAYIQGKYDALRELTIKSNSNTTDVLNKIKAEIEKIPTTPFATAYTTKREALKIIDKYIEEMENKKCD